MFLTCGATQKGGVNNGRPELTQLEIDPIAQRLGDVRASDPVTAGKIGKRAGNFQDSMVGTSREREALGGLQQQRLAVLIGVDHLFDQRRAGGGIGVNRRLPSSR